MASNGTAAAKKTEIGADDVKAQIATLQADVAELTRTMSAYGKNRGNEARAAASRRAEEVRVRAEALGHDAEAQLRQGYAQAETAVRDNPAAAVGIAAGVGFLLGLISARR
ncbi:glycine zipper domain-containing protein [Pseudooceanicola sp. C21-150M6]|uniref:glycine zipper domain-containing protein n=1 Tax=Pseudooceanicola sp. C21-150M6 TaxID=3434355 RepID=UPI003D7F893F